MTTEQMDWVDDHNPEWQAHLVSEKKTAPVEPAKPVARYETRIHARNRHGGYGKKVVVYATSQQEAVNKAIALGWIGRTSDARCTVDNVTEVPPGAVDNEVSK